MVSKKKRDAEALLAVLLGERDEVEAQIETMIADMAQLLPEQRRIGDWAPGGALTRRYLAATNRQSELEAEIEMLKQAASSRTPSN